MVKKALVYLPILILIGVSLYFILVSSLSVRYWVDDFCSAAFLRNNGFIGVQIAWYKSWTGRYSAVFFTDLFESIGSWIVRILPFLLYIVFSFSLYLIFRNLFFNFLFSLIILANAPNIIQSFYWQTGSLNYFIEFIFLNFFLYFLISKKAKRKKLVAFILIFVAAGFSEAFALSLLPFLFGLLLVVFISKSEDKKSRLKFLAFGILGLFASLFIMYFSPGNQARSQTVTKPDSMLFVIKSTILSVKWYILRMFSINTFNYSLVLLFSSSLLFVNSLKIKFLDGVKLIFVFLLIGIFSLMMVIFSGFYSMSILPPERTLFVGVSMLLYSFLAIFISFAGVINKHILSFKKRFLVPLAVVLNFLFCGLLLFSLISHWQNVYKEINDYALSWDSEVKNLPKIRNIKPVGQLDSFTDHKGWVSSCIANYYGFEKIEIVE